jgi:hypothetical protein
MRELVMMVGPALADLWEDLLLLHEADKFAH